MNENDVKPAAWRYKDFNPALAGGYAYGYTHDPQGPVCHEPLYDRSAIDRLTAELNAARERLAEKNEQYRWLQRMYEDDCAARRVWADACRQAEAERDAAIAKERQP